MKKLCFLITFFLLHEAKCQYNLKADLLPIFVANPRVFRPSFEKTFSKYISGNLTFEIGRYSSSERDSATFKIQSMETRGWAFMPEIRLYPLGKKIKAPLGFYVGSHYLYRNLNEHFIIPGVDITSKASQKGFGLSTGYKIIFLERFTIDFLLGYSFAQGTWKSTNGNRNLIAPSLGYDLNNPKNFTRFEISLGAVFPKIASEQSSQKNKKLKEIATRMEGEDSSFAQLIIYRPLSYEGETVEFDLSINDSVVTHIKNNSYYTQEIFNDNIYKITGITEDTVSVNVDLKKGYIYYLECTIGPGTTMGLPRFKLVPEHKAEPKIKKILQRKEK